jgi:hypothetical protein
MCHHITATLPHAVDLKSVASVFETYKLGFELISNPHVAAQIDPRAWYVLTSRKHCDCGTALGSLTHQTTTNDLSYDRDVQKFRKQGWSEAKIKRWLEQKEQTWERHRRKDEAVAESASYELERWVEFINELLKTKHTPQFGVLLHWYHTSIEGERIKIHRKERVRLSDLNAERLLRIEEDVLYEFVP